jgi:GNAT superfamily N-acetyltransferase
VIAIKRPQTNADFKEYYNLRYQVLREPYGQLKGTEKDDYEPLSEHFMAVDETTGAVVGVVKLYEKEPGVISHLCVAKELQGRGIGRALVQAAETVARQRGFAKVGSTSRLTATKFFEKYGYHIAGLPAIHFGTVHMVWMEKDLSAGA